MHTSSNRCDQGAWGQLHVGGYDTPSSVALQWFEEWGWTGEFGASSFQANHSVGLITIPTRCPFQWWSKPMWATLHSLILRLHAYLSFIMWCLKDPRRFAPMWCDLRSVTFCSAADKTVINRDNRGWGKRTGKNVSVFFLLASCGVNNGNVAPMPYP